MQACCPDSYAGNAIEIHYGPTPQQVAVAVADMPRMRWLVGVGAPPNKPASTTTAESVNPKTYNNADALLDVARVFLDAAPEDRSGEDRTMVVVQSPPRQP